MILVIGTFRAPQDRLEAVRPAMRAMIEASRGEDGCRLYAYSEDVLEPGLIHVTEAWRDMPALDAHLRSPHILAWRARWTELGLHDRRLERHETEGPRPV